MNSADQQGPSGIKFIAGAVLGEYL